VEGKYTMQLLMALIKYRLASSKKIEKQATTSIRSFLSPSFMFASPSLFLYNKNSTKNDSILYRC
jgi:hypothetical protein